MGAEVPRGALTPYALECEYERPLARIDELNYALTVDGLREAIEAQGVRPDAPANQDPAPQVVTPDLEALDRKGLMRLCELYRLELHGSAKQLRQRIESYLQQQQQQQGAPVQQVSNR